MDYFRYTFNEDQWMVYLIDDEDNVISDEGTAAEVKFDEREIYFRRSEVSIKNILHELWHVYFSYCYLSDTSDIELSDFEEITASLFADKAIRMIETAKDIEIKLNKLKEEVGETEDK